MEFEFSYKLPVGEHDIEGTATLEEYQPDADGYIHFRIAHIELNEAVNKAPIGLPVVRAITEWVRAMVEADEDVEAAWDEFIGNEVESPNAGNGTLFARMGMVA